MLEASQLWKIATALIEAVRSKIEFSENILKLYSLYIDENFFYDRRIKLDLLRDRDSYYNKEYARDCLSDEVGVCGELCIVLCFLAQYIDPPIRHEKIYISCVTMPHHTFCVMHQDYNFHMTYKTNDNSFICNRFEELKYILPENSIIVDPWVYSAVYITNLSKLGEIATNYGVRTFYIGAIKRNKLSFEVGEEKHTIPPGFQEILNIYDRCSQQEPHPLKIQEGGGRDILDVRKRLRRKHTPLGPKQRICTENLISFRQFVTLLYTKQSYIYKNFGSDRKGILFSQVIDFIDGRIQYQDDIPVQMLSDIMRALLKLTVLVRGGEPPANLNILNLTMTNSAKALLAYLPQNPYSFESIEGMSLQFIREIKHSSLNERVRYFNLCWHLHHRHILHISELNQENYTNQYFESQLVNLYLPHYKAFCYSALEYALTAWSSSDSD